MRRLIERVVTVVTTTTWKISWEADPTASMPAEEAAPPDPTVFEPKEVDLPEEKENATDQP